MKHVLRSALAFCCSFAALALCGAVPELEKLVPGATGYELIFKINPKGWPGKGYEVDRSADWVGRIDRIGYLLKLTGKDGKVNWAFASMDAFTQDLMQLGIPAPGGAVFQTYVKNLEVASNVPGIRTGKFPQGNVEIWGNNYGGGNAKNIPGASSGSYDFGDQAASDGNYGSLQIHNYLQKQTVIAYNHFAAGLNSDLGIGSNPKGSPDWTFAANCKNYKATELYIVAKGQFKPSGAVKLNADKCQFRISTNKDPLTYQPGEEMTFTFTVVNGGPAPTLPYSIRYTRSGDDGKVVNGVIPFKNAPVSIKTSLEKPGFVRVEAQLVDRSGNVVTRKGNPARLFVDGGAAVQPEKLTGTAEPADFDAFWSSQKAKLAAVPVKVLEMKKIRSGKNADIFQVKVACAGPAPVTGYLTIPKNAKPKSLPVRVMFMGYGYAGGRDVVPADGPAKTIHFTINAHGYDLGRDAAYYAEFGKKIRTARYSYAFDPDQNKNRDTAYFNGMALRVMRALQFVKTLPQYNGKTLIVSGGSQGGLQTIWAAGLDPDVVLAEPSIPWCCDLGGNRNFKRLCGGWRIPYVPALEYYDPIQFAKRIRCRTVVTRAGLGDYVCPPSGVAVFYNNLKCPKEIRWYQNSEHGYVPVKPEIFIRKAN